MASNSDVKPVFVFGAENDPETIGITGGPSDLDIWLAYRGTLSSVSFFLDRPTAYPQFHQNDYRTFMPSKILSMTRLPDERNTEEAITGYTFKGNYRYFFEMRYNPRSKEGTVWFPNRGEDPDLARP